MFKKICNGFYFTLVLLLFTVGIFLIISGLRNQGGHKGIFGYRSYVVLTDSMSPAFDAGDVVFSKPRDTIKEQDIIVYMTEKRITHRVIEIKEEDGIQVYITKGDNNPTQDSWTVYNHQIEGVVVGSIPKVGYIIEFFKTSAGLFVLISIPFLYFIVKVLKLIIGELKAN